METIKKAISWLNKIKYYAYVSLITAGTICTVILFVEMKRKIESVNLNFQNQDQRQWQMQQTFILGDKVFNSLKQETKIIDFKECFKNDCYFCDRSNEILECIKNECGSKPYGCSDIVILKEKIMINYYVFKNEQTK